MYRFKDDLIIQNSDDVEVGISENIMGLTMIYYYIYSKIITLLLLYILEKLKNSNQNN